MTHTQELQRLLHCFHFLFLYIYKRQEELSRDSSCNPLKQGLLTLSFFKLILVKSKSIMSFPQATYLPECPIGASSLTISSSWCNFEGLTVHTVTAPFYITFLHCWSPESDIMSVFERSDYLHLFPISKPFTVMHPPCDTCLRLTPLYYILHYVHDLFYRAFRTQV